MKLIITLYCLWCLPVYGATSSRGDLASSTTHSDSTLNAGSDIWELKSEYLGDGLDLEYIVALRKFLEKPSVLAHVSHNLNLDNESSGRSAQTLFINGAGPAGLFATILAIKSGQNVVLNEKRTTYSRNQVMRVDEDWVEVFKELTGSYYKYAEGNLSIFDAPGPFHPDSKRAIVLKHLEVFLAAVVEVIAQTAPDRLKVFYGSKLGPEHFSDDGIISFPSNDGPVLFKPDFIVGADGAGSITGKRYDMTQFCVSEPSYATVATYTNWSTNVEGGICPIVATAFQEGKVTATEVTDVDRNRSAEELSDFGWNPVDVGTAPGTNPRYRAFVLDSDIYLGVEASKAIYDAYQALPVEERNGFILDYSKATLRSIIGHHADNLEIKSKAIDKAFFQIKLTRVETPVKGLGTTSVVLLGDAVGTTHFFTGTGVNQAFLHAKLLSQVLLGNMDLESYRATALNGIENMHEKCFGGKGAPPDSKGEMALSCRLK